MITRLEYLSVVLLWKRVQKTARIVGDPGRPGMRESYRAGLGTGADRQAGGSGGGMGWLGRSSTRLAPSVGGARLIAGSEDALVPLLGRSGGSQSAATRRAGNRRMVCRVIGCRIEGRTASPGHRRSVSDEHRDTCSPRRRGTLPGECQSGPSLGFAQDFLLSPPKRVTADTRHMESSTPSFLKRNLGTERFVQLRTPSKTTDMNS